MKNKPTILVAEDDRDDKFLLQTVFEERGGSAVLEFVSNGVELLNYLDNICNTNHEYPNLILLDLNMPKMDGREALEKIKNQPAYSNIPIVVFSTTRNEKEIKRCYELGVASYMVKPSNYESFLETIDAIRSFCKC